MKYLLSAAVFVSFINNVVALTCHQNKTANAPFNIIHSEPKEQMLTQSLY